MTPIKTTIVLSIAIFIGYTSCTKNYPSAQEVTMTEKEEAALWELATTYLFPLDRYDLLEEVGATAAQIELGKELFHETKLSIEENQSCNSCHNLKNYGVDNQQFSKGSVKGTLGTRNSPTVFDAAYHYAQFWDGRVETVEQQAAIPILNPQEMGMPNEELVVERLRNESDYLTKFQKAFPNQTHPLTFVNVTRAIGAFERTLVTTSRFDDYIAGDKDALSVPEKKGLSLFISLNCTPCHSGTTVGGLMPQRFGQLRNYTDYTRQQNSDRGVASRSNDVQDNDIFKVPSLRNVIHTAPYFHDGSVETIEEAISIMGKAQLNQELTTEQITSIKTFLACLSE